MYIMLGCRACGSQTFWGSRGVWLAEGGGGLVRSGKLCMERATGDEKARFRLWSCSVVGVFAAVVVLVCVAIVGEQVVDVRQHVLRLDVSLKVLPGIVAIAVCSCASCRASTPITSVAITSTGRSRS